MFRNVGWTFIIIVFIYLFIHLLYLVVFLFITVFLLFKFGNYFRRERYLFDNNDDQAKTLGDSKPKHYHKYMYTESKVKSHEATVSNIYMCLLQLVSTVTLLQKSSFVVDVGHHTNVWIVESI